MLTPNQLGYNATIRELLQTVPHDILDRFPFIEQWADDAQAVWDADYHPDEFPEVLHKAENETDKVRDELKDYNQFFENCFSMLDGAYPCPSVTSDYDTNLIFSAIVRGEQVKEEV